MSHIICQVLGPVYTERRRQRCGNVAMTAVVENNRVVPK